MHSKLPLLPAVMALLGAAVAPAQALGGPYVPPQNPLTAEKVMLGKFLFWDEQLSSDDSMACGTCHLPELGGGDDRLGVGVHPGRDLVYGTDDDIHGSAGVVRQTAGGDFRPHPFFGLDRQVTNRAAPSNLGAGHHASLFWDGRADGTFVDPETGVTLLPVGGALENQSLAPILSATEMARTGRSWSDVRQKLQSAPPLLLASNLPLDMQAARQQNPTYPLLFQAAFGDPTISAARIAFALASYQRTLNPDDTAWDRYVGGQPSAMTNAEKDGWTLFQGASGCISCHWTPLFSDDLPHNLGLRPASEDLGAVLVTGDPFDVGGFKTPSLRNAGLRPRLFHNGQSPALLDPAQLTDPASTLNVYFTGHGVDTSNLDPFMQPLGPLGVTIQDVQKIQAFVATALTDWRAAGRLPPFDRPDLRSETVAPPRVFGPSLAGASTPRLIDSVPSYPGNADFRLGLTGGYGAGLALLTWGLQSYEPSALVAGLPWHVDVAGWQPFVLDGLAGRPGYATWHLPLPDDPALQTVPFYFQLFAVDALAPTGVAASRGSEFFIR